MGKPENRESREVPRDVNGAAWWAAARGVLNSTDVDRNGRVLPQSGIQQSTIPCSALPGLPPLPPLPPSPNSPFTSFSRPQSIPSAPSLDSGHCGHCGHCGRRPLGEVRTADLNSVIAVMAREIGALERENAALKKVKHAQDVLITGFCKLRVAEYGKPGS